ncbi:MAG: hypothetical protein M3Z10_05655, partial [Gemmatimonadota bacterium]|nr:hypothetical protein [Gemmatimonadota bacterium]
MTHMTSAAFAALGLLVLAGAAGPAGAQEDRSSKDICTAAARVAVEAHNARVVSSAYGVLARCPNGSATLAAAWASPPADAEALTQLAHRSVEVADRRILDASLTALQNTAASAAARRAALDVVLSQYNPEVVVSNSTWADPEHTSLGRRNDYYQVTGEQPITATDRDRIVAVFRAMKDSDPDTQLRR